MSEQSDKDDMVLQMIIDLGFGKVPVWHSPDWLNALCDTLIRAGWRKQWMYPRT